MKRVLIAAIVVLSGITLSGQDTSNERPPFSERLFFGGSFGLQFGTITNIEASPVAGLWLLPRIAIAAGPSYQYYKDPVDATSIYGVRGYLQITLIQDLNNIIPIGVNTGIFVQAEYEGLSLERSFWSLVPDGKKRIFMGTFLAGAGISQPIGRRSSMNFTVLWALTDPVYQVYDSPEIRVSFNF
ncbi:MAG TPA: hypothetical protein VMV74_01890 [Bacteroidales bacterium]|nr:hypothetical protein [Bacteroidales bacterium]